MDRSIDLVKFSKRLRKVISYRCIAIQDYVKSIMDKIEYFGENYFYIYDKFLESFELEGPLLFGNTRSFGEEYEIKIITEILCPENTPYDLEKISKLTKIRESRHTSVNTQYPTHIIVHNGIPLRVPDYWELQNTLYKYTFPNNFAYRLLGNLLTNLNILKVERVENIRLYHLFQNYMHTLSPLNPKSKSLDEMINMKYFYYFGTKKEIEKWTMSRNGFTQFKYLKISDIFNKSLINNGYSPCLYDSTFQLDDSYQDGDEVKTLVICRVAMGLSCFKTVDELDNNMPPSYDHENYYDTVLVKNSDSDNIAAVVFDEYAVYPEFIISFNIANSLQNTITNDYSFLESKFANYPNTIVEIYTLLKNNYIFPKIVIEINMQKNNYDVGKIIKTESFIDTIVESHDYLINKTQIIDVKNNISFVIRPRNTLASMFLPSDQYITVPENWTILPNFHLLDRLNKESDEFREIYNLIEINKATRLNIEIVYINRIQNYVTLDKYNSMKMSDTRAYSVFGEHCNDETYMFYCPINSKQNFEDIIKRGFDHKQYECTNLGGIHFSLDICRKYLETIQIENEQCYRIIGSRVNLGYCMNLGKNEIPNLKNAPFMLTLDNEMRRYDSTTMLKDDNYRLFSIYNGKRAYPEHEIILKFKR